MSSKVWWALLAAGILAACGKAAPLHPAPGPDSGLPAGCLDNDGDGFPGTGDCTGVSAALLDCDDNDPTIHPGATEVCNGKDDDCDGTVDNVRGTHTPLSQACYSGPAATRAVGPCKDGTQSCTAGQWATCGGEVVPAAETCNGVDDDCDGKVDNLPGTANPLTQACYSGPAQTKGVGACKDGAQVCVAGAWSGACTGEVLPATETCNGLDDDCDGHVDNVPGSVTPLSQACYDGPAGTLGVANCKGGAQTCSAGSWGSCAGEVLPAAETCNNLDDDCDGRVDNIAGTANPITQSCYTGPNGTVGVGVCTAGSSACIAGSYGACTGQVLPSTDVCNGRDDDCDGHVDNVPGTANPLTQSCYTGPGGTQGVGVCTGGTATCSGGTYGACAGQVLPSTEVCNSKDDDCDGHVDNIPGTTNPLTQSCYTGPGGTLGVGVCAAGTATCSSGSYGACAGQVLPSTDVCNGRDDDCDGHVDNVPGTTNPLTQSCYTGPGGTVGVGVCTAGTATCSAGTYGACAGQVLPSTDVCNGKDDDCDGHVDNIPGTTNPLTQACYDGPPGTLNVGVCKGGTATCGGGVYGSCAGEVLPQPPACDGFDNNCNGVVDEPFISATSNIDSSNQWTDLAFAPYYYSAGSCAGGANGSGTDALAGGGLVGTTSGTMWFQQLDVSGNPLGAPKSVEPYGYDQVAIAQSGDGFLLAGIWNGDHQSIDLAYVDAAGNRRTDLVFQFTAGTSGNLLDSLRFVRGNARRATLFWREYTPSGSQTSTVGLHTSSIEPQSDNSNICNAGQQNCGGGTNGLGALYWVQSIGNPNVPWPISAGLGADSDHSDWAPSQTCVSTSTLRHLAVAYVYQPTSSFGGCAANSNCVSYFDVMEDASQAPPCNGGSGPCNPFPGTGMWGENSPRTITEPELAYYFPTSGPGANVREWMTSWVTGYPSAVPPSADLDFWMTSVPGWNFAYLANATDNGVSSILHPRATVTATDALLTALRYVPDASGFKRQMMSRHIDFGGNRVPAGQAVELSAMTGACGPVQCRPGNKAALANWALKQKIFYSGNGSPSGTYDSTLTCN